MKGGLPITASNVLSLLSHQEKKSPAFTTPSAWPPSLARNNDMATSASAGMISTPVSLEAIDREGTFIRAKRSAAATRNAPPPQLGSRTASVRERIAHSDSQRATSGDV